MAMHRPNMSSSLDSPYEAELRRGVAGRIFGQHLENEYVASRLLKNRPLIRVTCVLGVLLSLSCVVRHFLVGYLSHDYLPQIAVVFLASVALASVACSSLFERLYLPLAKVAVPVRNAIAAVLIARLAAQGHMETLMVLPRMVVGPFFLLGLPPRVALFSVVVTIATFALSATAFAAVADPALSATAFACALMVVVTVACVVASRHIEEGSRKSFLESGLIAEFAEYDALTGTKNRRMFDEHLARLWQQAIENGRTIAVLLIDVDYFKKYNDRYGHQAGDQALRRVAETLQTFVDRPLDLLARYGGEEFAVVLNDTESPQAAHIADRMRRAVCELGIEQRDGISGRVTISVGAAVLAPTAERGPRGALQLADQALYEAKMRGRNRVEIKEDEDYTLLVTGVFSKSALPGARHDVEIGTSSVRVARA
ncbi:MAG TPA: GGDEF domain-containing protein [Woeseiaceae bacterium]|nr:GGDEF domain-containing protein [Woeseiaceae bacterium]